MRTAKILYAPRDRVSATVQLQNRAAVAQTADLRITLHADLGHERELQRLTLTVPPGGTPEQTLVFPLADEAFGCELRACLRRDGRTLAEARDYFSVAESFLQVGIGSDWGSALHTGLGKHLEVPEQARRIYSNWFELFFWSPCDWALHLAPAKQWWSGQASYPQNEDNLKELLARCHEQGIHVAFYASGNPAGPFGWEAARRRPEWFGGGSFTGAYHVEALEKWNDAGWRQGTKGNPGWFRIPVDLRRLDAVDYGIDRLLDSIRAYGWDAVRFDGHYTVVGNDPLSTRNMRRLKERVWQARPGFRFGFNYGRAPEWQGGLTHELREGMAGGGLYLQEGIRNWRHTNDSYSSWRHYATNELRIAKQIQALGGSYHCMWSDSSLTPEQARYKLLYGLIAGGHPAGSEIYTKAPGCANWGAFMTRWSALLWHPDLHRDEAAVARLSVDPADLQWQEFLQAVTLSPTRRLLVQHLVRPPASDRISDLAPPKSVPPKATVPDAGEAEPDTDPGPALGLGEPDPVETAAPAAPPPAPQARVSFRPEPGTHVLRAVAIRPDSTPWETELATAANGDRIEVALPVPNPWTLLVWELAGHFDVPPPPPPFTEPPDAAALGPSPSEPLLSRPDPNQPELVRAAAAHDAMTVVPLSSGGVNIGRVTTVDPESAQGTVQWRDPGKPTGRIGKWWTGPYPPGRYRLGVRLKWTDPAAAATPQSLSLRVLGDKELPLLPEPCVLVTPGHPSPPPNSRPLGERGSYRDYDLGTIDLRRTGLITFDGTAATTRVGQHTLYAEAFTVRLLERHTDAQLAGVAESAKPPGLRTPAGATPQQVLLVRGLFSGLYGLERVTPVTSVYAVPDSHAELYAYDAVVLSNTETGAMSLECRRRLHDYVRDGGRLVMLGGNRAFGPGHMAATFLADLCPFAVTGTDEVVRCAPPLPLRPLPAPGDTPDAPLLFWRHDLVPKPAATVLATAGHSPVAAWTTAGKGRVYAFAGTVLGEPAAGQTPFWTTATWTALLKQMVTQP